VNIAKCSNSTLIDNLQVQHIVTSKKKKNNKATLLTNVTHKLMYTYYMKVHCMHAVCIYTVQHISHMLCRCW